MHRKNTRSKGCKLWQGKFQLDVRKHKAVLNHPSRISHGKKDHHHLSKFLLTFSQLIPDIKTELYTRSLSRFSASMAQHHLLQNGDSYLFLPTCAAHNNNHCRNRFFKIILPKQTNIKLKNRTIHKDETIRIGLLKHVFLNNINCRWV